jgi:hypothetical protein
MFKHSAFKLSELLISACFVFEKTKKRDYILVVFCHHDPLESGSPVSVCVSRQQAQRALPTKLGLNSKYKAPVTARQFKNRAGTPF